MTDNNYINSLNNRRSLQAKYKATLSLHSLTEHVYGSVFLFL